MGYVQAVVVIVGGCICMGVEMGLWGDVDGWSPWGCGGYVSGLSW